MSTYRTTFNRRPGRQGEPEVIGAADFEDLDTATAAGQQWIATDPAWHGYDVELIVDTVARSGG